jgi:REP element-mobilizing transposase RayT
MFQEEGYYFVTSRCFQGRMLLRPSLEVNEVVGGVLAKAVQHSAGGVRLHAFTFASNHFHLLVWARGACLASFMQYLRANLSKKVGRWVDWSGGFWERRYSAEPVLDDTALVGRLRYVLAHGVKEGWVEVAPLPCWVGKSEEERQGAVRELLQEVEAEARVRGKPALGAQAVQAQHPHTRPERLKRSPRPLGHASTRQALRELREQYRAFVAVFREAAARWRRGIFWLISLGSPSLLAWCRVESFNFFDTYPEGVRRLVGSEVVGTSPLTPSRGS